MNRRLDAAAMGGLLCAFAWSLGAADPPAGRAAQSPTETECRSFAEQLEREMVESKGQAFVRALDTDAMLDSALRNIGAGEQSRRDFRTGFKSGYVKNLAK